MKKILFGLTILFSINLCGCSNEQADIRSEQDNFEITEEQYIAEEDLQDGMQASLEQERIIQDQSFTVELNDWGSVGFVSYKPDRDVIFDDVSFYLMKGDQVIYEFPYYCEGNNTSNYVGLFEGVEAVGFRDCNNDGKNDIIIIIDYIIGAGPQAVVPRPTARIFLAEEKGFYVAEDMMADISEHIAEKDLTVDSVYQYILSKDAENSTAEAYEPEENRNSPQLYAKYFEVLMQILNSRTDPNGKYFDDGSQGTDFSGNCFAITDIDGDGRDELIFNYNDTYMAAMQEIIYDYDEKNDILRTELEAFFVMNTYYSNGYVKVDASHNHTCDPETRGIWPYSMYKYDAETDSYIDTGYVECWDELIFPINYEGEAFPGELDTDGDNLLFCVDYSDAGTDDVERTYMDREEFDAWEKTIFPEEYEIDIEYHHMTEEEIENIKTIYP